MTGGVALQLPKCDGMRQRQGDEEGFFRAVLQVRGRALVTGRPARRWLMESLPVVAVHSAPRKSGEGALWMSSVKKVSLTAFCQA